MLHQRFRFQFLKRKCVFCTDERPRKVKADAEFVCLFCAEPERGDGGLVADEVQLVVTGQQQDSFQGDHSSQLAAVDLSLLLFLRVCYLLVIKEINPKKC